MNPIEQTRLHVLNTVLEHQLPAAQAAEILGVSERHAWRILAAYRKEGAAALAHGNRGRRPRDAASAAATVVQLASTTYAGANHTHLTELLREREGIDLGRQTVPFTTSCPATTLSLPCPQSCPIQPTSPGSRRNPWTRSFASSTPARWPETTRSSTSGAPCNCCLAPNVPATLAREWKCWNTPTAGSRCAKMARSFPVGQRRRRPGALRASHGALAPSPEISRIVKRLGNHRLSQPQLRHLANLELDPVMEDDDQVVCSSAERSLPERRELSPRQLALWKAVQQAKIQGLSLREIACQLGISRNTVRKYARALVQPTNRPHNQGRRPSPHQPANRSD